MQGGDPMEQDSLSRTPVPTESALWVYFLEVVGWCLEWYEAEYWLCWFWNLLGGALVQTIVSHSLYPAQGHLV